MSDAIIDILLNCKGRGNPLVKVYFILSLYIHIGNAQSSQKAKRKTLKSVDRKSCIFPSTVEVHVPHGHCKTRLYLLSVT